MGSKFKLALIQLAVGSNKAENLSRALAKISEAVNNGAQVVSLPGDHFCLLVVTFTQVKPVLWIRNYLVRIRILLFRKFWYRVPKI